MDKLIIFTILLLIAGATYAYDDGDFQVWHTDFEEKRINEKFKISMEEEFRWGDNASELYYQHYEPGLTYEVNEHFDLSLKYRQIYNKKNGKFKQENQPNLNATLKWQSFGCTFSDRSRLEYKHFNYQPDSWMYRNKLISRLPWKFTKFEIQPYLSDEIFINFYNTAFARNRFYAGFNFTLTKNIKAEIYYLLQSTKSSHEWVEANVFGSKLKITF